MTYCNLSDLRLPHYDVAAGIIIGYDERQFVAIFTQNGLCLGHIELIDEQQALTIGQFKRIYTKVCRSIMAQHNCPPRSVGFLMAEIEIILPKIIKEI